MQPAARQMRRMSCKISRISIRFNSHQDTPFIEGTKKADVAEHLTVFSHVGLPENRLLRIKLPFRGHPTTLSRCTAIVAAVHIVIFTNKMRLATPIGCLWANSWE